MTVSVPTPTIPATCEFSTTEKSKVPKCRKIIANPIMKKVSPMRVVIVAMLMVAVGFGFKVSAVPFHLWAPDTYEGAPLPLTAFLSVASKAAGFVGLIILMFGAFPFQAHVWAPIFAVLSVLTMTLGNLTALKQTQMVRLLAYSSIAQAGYILLPFALAEVPGEIRPYWSPVTASLIYIFIYAVMNLGAFAVVIAMSGEAPNLAVDDFTGLAKRAPALGIAFVAFLLSLGGIPPFAGFWAKFFVFKAAIEAGGRGPLLAAIMVVNTVIGLGYYLRVAKRVALEDPQPELATTRPRIDVALTTAIGIAAVLVLAIGVYPDLIAKLTPFA